MKLVFCIKSLYYAGGIERVLTNRLNYYIKNNYNYEITILTTDQNNNNYFYNIDKKIEIIDLGINYFDSESKNFFKRVIEFKKKQKIHLKKLNQIINNINPDIIISFGYQDKWLLPFLQKKSKIILEHHTEKNFALKQNNNIFYKIKNYYHLWKEKKLITLYDKFLVLTEEDKKQWNDKRVEVIPNSLTFYPERFSDCENKKIISVGRLTHEKGYDILIDVWNIVAKKYSDWTLEIYGEGPERENLQNKINKLELEKSFLLKGTDKNIQNRYIESSIYVMSSRSEAMPMVLLEAMSCGLPVVSFDSPCGPKDIIKENEDGFIIKFGDIGQMAEKIEELIVNKEKRKLFGANARYNIQRFSQDKIMNQWEKIYGELK